MRKQAEQITTENFIPLVHKAVATMPLKSVNGSATPKDSTFSDAWLDLGLNVRSLIDRQDASDIHQKETDTLLAGEKAKRVLLQSAFGYVKSMAWWQRVLVLFIVGEWIWVHAKTMDFGSVAQSIGKVFGL